MLCKLMEYECSYADESGACKADSPLVVQGFCPLDETEEV